ncbi:MAG: glycosyltransferase, partial [Acetobacteraceae bacterium]|nr:glycosyltransferase [Acetobacteraceae bacterium]
VGALPGVEVAADVADMRAVLARTRVGLAPMRAGSGIKNKVLEAWACARPVVMTRVAANGLSVPEGHASLVRDGPEAQAEAAIGPLRDPGRAAALGALARAHVAAVFSWERQAERLDRILREAGPPV